MKDKVDIIVSCFNEEDNIFQFFDEAKKYLRDSKYIYNIVFINDGSTDKTYDKVIELKKTVTKDNLDISIVSFVQNFGHEAAMCAGLDISDADYLIFMDVDLQNPPGKIPSILQEFSKGADCILMRRVKYNAAFIKKLFSNGYYLFSSIVLRNKNARNVSDFFAINKVVANTVRDKYKTRLRFVRSFVQREAKNIKFLEYENAKRNSGKSRYSFLKLLRLAIISELSRSEMLRQKYKATYIDPVYMIDNSKTIYVTKEEI